jgi:hypothetical protein
MKRNLWIACRHINFRLCSYVWVCVCVLSCKKGTIRKPNNMINLHNFIITIKNSIIPYLYFDFMTANFCWSVWRNSGAKFDWENIKFVWRKTLLIVDTFLLESQCSFLHKSSAVSTIRNEAVGCKICGFHCEDYKECYILGFDAVGFL